MLCTTQILSSKAKLSAFKPISNERRSIRIFNHSSGQHRSLSAYPSSHLAPTGQSQQQQEVQNIPSIDRRAILLTTLTSFSLLATAAPAAKAAGNDAVTAGIDRYIKRKKMDSIDSYVPQLLEARDQLVRTERVMLTSADDARQLLRSGVFKGIRRSIKAVGDYVGETQTPEKGTTLVNNFLSALEKLDGELLIASRSETPSLDVAKVKVVEARDALNAIVAALPSGAVEYAEKVLAAVNDDIRNGGEGEIDLSDPELTKLRKLL